MKLKFTKALIKHNQIKAEVSKTLVFETETETGDKSTESYSGSLNVYYYRSKVSVSFSQFATKDIKCWSQSQQRVWIGIVSVMVLTKMIIIVFFPTELLNAHFRGNNVSKS